MGRRGQQPIEERIGLEKFKELLKRLDIPDISKLYCEHEVEPRDKERCKACRRSIYRAKKRIVEREKAKKRYDPIDEFVEIPEIKQFLEYERAKGKAESTISTNLSLLKRYWTWIKDSELKELQRPALWDNRHLIFILNKLKETRIGLYAPKKALRRFYESQGNLKLMKHPLIRASRKDMRSPNGSKRKKTEFSPKMLTRIYEVLESPEEKLAIDLHLTCKSREGHRGKGSLMNCQWKDINWKDTFYGFVTETIDIYEPKTKGGTWWRHIPLGLWFADLPSRLKAKWESLGCPEDGYILDYDYPDYSKLWRTISKKLNRKLEPHDCRRSAGGWLRDLGLSELALGQYNPNTGEATGYTGVGWENAEIYFQRYGKMNPKAIFDKASRLDAKVFDGLIHKMIQNR